ncbi:MAG TPA: acyl carrier protein [Pirellulales bacterium]|nr:acyl carrier protein [Pirellulales bacterium]
MATPFIQEQEMSVRQLKPGVPTTESEPDLSDLYSVVSSVFEVPRERLNPETSFTEDLGADSLDIVELAMALEERFEISVPDDAASRMKTVRDLACLLPSIHRSGSQLPR